MLLTVIMMRENRYGLRILNMSVLIPTESMSLREFITRL